MEFLIENRDAIIGFAFALLNGLIFMLIKSNQARHTKRRERLENRFSMLEESEQKDKEEIERLKKRMDENDERDRRDKEELQKDIKIAVLEEFDKRR